MEHDKAHPLGAYQQEHVPDGYPGFIGTQLRNATNGKWRDDQLYVAVIGRDPTTQVFSWVKPDGALTAAKVEDNDGAGHLTKDGQNYPNYFFTLAQAKLLKLPKMDSGPHLRVRG